MVAIAGHHVGVGLADGSYCRPAGVGVAGVHFVDAEDDLALKNAQRWNTLQIGFSPSLDDDFASPTELVRPARDETGPSCAAVTAVDGPIRRDCIDPSVVEGELVN